MRIPFFSDQRHFVWENRDRIGKPVECARDKLSDRCWMMELVSALCESGLLENQINHWTGSPQVFRHSWNRSTVGFAPKTNTYRIGGKDGFLDSWIDTATYSIINVSCGQQLLHSSPSVRNQTHVFAPMPEGFSWVVGYWTIGRVFERNLTNVSFLCPLPVA
ncbi:nAD+ synthase [Anopheles sinensis]|uniref:NAD+ synthase n=1 Tax=Anopheles sinensis TaxID=74873 RepID=A0A084VZ52_ANOSI|nr:nAD+ synthase [Anopheles sinensis]